MSRLHDWTSITTKKINKNNSNYTQLKLFQIPLALLFLFVLSTEAQTRKVRLRQPQRPVQIESIEEETSEEDQRSVIQYYRPQPKQDNAQELVYVSEDEYQNLYAQSQTTARPRDYRPAVTSVRPLPRASHAATTLAPRTKISEEKQPPVQTLRNFNKVNDDGSFTFGNYNLRQMIFN